MKVRPTIKIQKSSGCPMIGRETASIWKIDAMMDIGMVMKAKTDRVLVISFCLVESNELLVSLILGQFLSESRLC